MWDRVQSWLEQWGTGRSSETRVLRRLAADRPVRISGADAEALVERAVAMFHRGQRDRARPILERALGVLPPGEPAHELGGVHLDAIVTGVSCGCPLRDRITALLGSEPSVRLSELEAGSDLVAELEDGLRTAAAAARLRWDALHLAGTFSDDVLLLVVGGDLAPGDEARADEVLEQFLRDRDLEGLVTIER